MDSRRFNVIVVGAGLAGLTAAGAAARLGQRVAIVASGPGSFVLGNGLMRAEEFAGLKALRAIEEATAFFSKMAQAAGCPFEGKLAEARPLPTILGDFESVAFAPRSLWHAEPRIGVSTAVVGIRELSSFDENFMAERLNEQVRGLGFTGSYAARQISLAHLFGCTVTTLRIASRFDRDAGFRAELLNTLRHAAQGFERVLLPAVLGLHSSAQQLAQFECELGCCLGELPTLPPSVSGLRLFHRLQSYLREIGVEVFEGFPVQKVKIDDGCGAEIHIASPGHPMIVRGECVVLAAGRNSASLLGGATAAHKKQIRTLIAAGEAMASNLIVADSSRCSGNAMEIGAGYRAGSLASARSEKYAER